MQSTTPHNATKLTSPRIDPRLSVVIVNYNGWDDVLRLLKILSRSPEVAAGHCEVIVVDNASEGPIPSELEPPPPGARLIARHDNGGFAAGVNTGWRAAQGDWLLVLNPDVLPSPDLLARVLERLERAPQGPPCPGIVGFGLRNPDGTRQPSVGPFPSLARTLWGQLIPRSRRKYQAGWRTRSGPVAWVTGACVLINARLLEQLGGMDEEFFLYYEEVALCRAARRAGWSVEYDPSIEVVHLHPLQNRPVSPKLRIITRHSKLLYFRKHLPKWQFLCLSRIVWTEGLVRGFFARLRRQDADVRAWCLIRWLARSMRRGATMHGTEVRILAESVVASRSRARLDPADQPAPRRVLPAREAENAEVE